MRVDPRDGIFVEARNPDRAVAESDVSVAGSDIDRGDEAEGDGERFLQVEWADEPTRPFDTTVVVTVTNGKGVLARVASAIASAEAPGRSSLRSPRMRWA